MEDGTENEDEDAAKATATTKPNETVETDRQKADKGAVANPEPVPRAKTNVEILTDFYLEIDSSKAGTCSKLLDAYSVAQLTVALQKRQPTAVRQFAAGWHLGLFATLVVILEWPDWKIAR